MSEVIVFYAGQVHWEFDSLWDYQVIRRSSLVDSEIYNGAYTYDRRDPLKKHWSRMDGTPVLLEDVPMALRTWVLLL